MFAKNLSLLLSEQGQNTTVKTDNKTWKNFVKELTRKMKVQIHKVKKLSQVKGKVCG